MSNAIETLRREAKRLSRATTITHMQALDVLAVQKGFTHWGALAQRIGIERPERPAIENRDVRAMLEHALQRPLPDIAGSRHLIVSGGAASGKTTLINMMVDRLPVGTVVSVIEHVWEVTLPNASIIRNRSKADGYGDDARLMAEALAERPDVLVVGELFPANAATVVDAMGMEEGPVIVCTVHAAAAWGAIQVVMQHAGRPYPGAGLPAGVAIVQLDREPMAGRRRISETMRT